MLRSHSLCKKNLKSGDPEFTCASVAIKLLFKTLFTLLTVELKLKHTSYLWVMSGEVGSVIALPWLSPPIIVWSIAVELLYADVKSPLGCESAK